MSIWVPRGDWAVPAIWERPTQLPQTDSHLAETATDPLTAGVDLEPGTAGADLEPGTGWRLEPRPLALLFDLDGTLTDSGPLVIDCFKKMLRQLWGEERAAQIPEAQLWSYLGPPLEDSMRDLEPGCSRERAAYMIEVYREYYLPRAHSSPLFPGVEAMLRQLHAQGYRMAVATSKLQEPAVRILQSLGVADLFETISGGIPGENASLKHQVVRGALERMGLGAPDSAAQVLMVGDRCYDVEGAAQEGAPAVLALWGETAGPGEAAGAVAVVDTPADLVQLLL